MYLPVNISEYNIYDIFHNDNNRLVIVSPIESAALNIRYEANSFFRYECSHRHTYIYVSKGEIKYQSNIVININGKDISTNVNKYPEFKDEIIMSTLVYNEDNYIKQWIQFHLRIGINRFIIYDNSEIDDKKSYKSIEETSDLRNVLKEYIESGIVILINWYYPKRLEKSGISGQTTQQSHSIWAFNNSKYIGLFDIDEYVNIQKYRDLQSCLNNLINSKKIDMNKTGGFKLLNKHFNNPDNMNTDGFNFLSISNCDDITLEGREKCFVIPKNVFTWSVHTVTLGKKLFSVDHKEIYFNHYIFLNKKERGRDRGKNVDISIHKHTEGLIHNI